MPTYEYECTANGHRFERVQKFSDPPVEECEVCGARVRRVIFPPPIIFRGPGFYKTDNAPKPPASATEDAGSGDGKADAGEKAADKKADARPETEAAKPAASTEE